MFFVYFGYQLFTRYNISEWYDISNKVLVLFIYAFRIENIHWNYGSVFNEQAFF